jgi:hypothetical protein
LIVGFDAHVPFPVAKAIRELSSERQIRRAFAKGKRELPEVKIVSFYDYEPKQADRDYIAKSDVPWLERLVKEGGPDAPPAASRDTSPAASPTPSPDRTADPPTSAARKHDRAPLR